MSKLSQLKKNQTDIFHVLFKNYYPRCYCKLDKKDTIGKEIEKCNKQNLFISQGVLLPENGIVKLQNTEKLIFLWRQRERRRAMA